MTTVYDVTTWSVPGNPSATPYNDIGLIINSIIADVKSQQTNQASKSGAVVYIPPGDYSLKTRVNVDISFLTIRGSGHGFTSSSIRYNAGNTSSWHEIFPGGSRRSGRTGAQRGHFHPGSRRGRIGGTERASCSCRA